MRRLVELDNQRRDVVFNLAYDYQALIPDVIDVLEIVDWDAGRAKTALAAGVSPRSSAATRKPD